MKNLLSHPSIEVRTAVIGLLDALTQYERSTGRNYLAIVKVDAQGEGYEYRSLSGGPASDLTTDEALLEAYAELAQER